MLGQSGQRKSLPCGTPLEHCATIELPRACSRVRGGHAWAAFLWPLKPAK